MHTTRLDAPTDGPLQSCHPEPGHSEPAAHNDSALTCPEDTCRSVADALSHRRVLGNADSSGVRRERWTLVDTYAYDGRQYVLVARQKEERVHALSRRERQALGVAVLGSTNKEIAWELGISISTVGVLIHRAKRKLWCRSRAELLAKFRQLAEPATEAVPRGAYTAPRATGGS